MSIAFVVALALTAGAAHGQLELVPLEDEFRVNTTVDDDQDSAAVACLSTGECIVAFRSPADSAILAQRYTADGAAIGDELELTDDNLADPALAAAGGALFLAWTSRTGDLQILGRTYDAALVPQRPVIEISGTGQQIRYDQDVACNPTGQCVVIWDEADTAVWARTYEASGNPRGPATMVASFVAPQSFPRVAIAPSGEFVVIWHHFAADIEESAVMARSFNAAGAPNGDSYVIALTRNMFTNPSGLGISVDHTGSFVAVWDSQLNADPELNFQPRPGEVWAQRLDVAAGLRGDPILVAAIDPSLRQIHSRVSTDRAGNFMIVWQDAQIDGDRERILARLYDAEGRLQGSTLQINAPNLDRHRSPAVAADATGNWFIAWEGQDRTPRGQTSRGVFARRFATLGEPEPTPSPQPTATATATISLPHIGDDGCAISTAGASPHALLLIAVPLALAGATRWRSRRASRARAARPRVVRRGLGRRCRSRR